MNREEALAILEPKRLAYIEALNGLSSALMADMQMEAFVQATGGSEEGMNLADSISEVDELLKAVDEYVDALVKVVEQFPDVDDDMIETAIQAPLGFVEDFQMMGDEGRAGDYMDRAKHAAYTACRVLCERWFHSGRRADLARATAMMKSAFSLLGPQHQGLQELVERVALRLRPPPPELKAFFKEQRRIRGGRDVDPATRMSPSAARQVGEAFDRDPLARPGRRADPAARVCLRLLDRRR